MKYSSFYGIEFENGVLDFFNKIVLNVQRYMFFQRKLHLEKYSINCVIYFLYVKVNFIYFNEKHLRNCLDKTFLLTLS